MSEQEFIETYRITDGGTVTVGAVPESVSRRYLYRQKVSNEGGVAKVVNVAQVGVNSFTDTTVVPANDSKNFGGKPSEDRLLVFDGGGTIEVQMPATSGTIDVVLGLVDT